MNEGENDRRRNGELKERKRPPPSEVNWPGIVATRLKNVFTFSVQSLVGITQLIAADVIFRVPENHYAERIKNYRVGFELSYTSAMAPMTGKRSRGEGINLHKSKKRQIIADKPLTATTPDQNVREAVEVDADALDWKEVALPDRLENAEGFFGLEEIEGVEVLIPARKDKPAHFKVSRVCGVRPVPFFARFGSLSPNRQQLMPNL
jgi:hypothetical protein